MEAVHFLLGLFGSIDTYSQTIRLATPLLLACLAGLYSERAGVFDIGLEGKMLAAAFLSAAFAYLSGSAWVGLGAGVLAAVMLSVLHGLASITFRGNQLISGVAINFLSSGLTVLLAQNWFKQGGRTPALDGAARFHELTLPMAETLAPVPVIGPIYARVLSGHSIFVYVAAAMVPATAWLLYRTRFGLRLRAVGENPAAVDTAGVSVLGYRWAAVVITGVLCGIAGAQMATAAPAAGFLKEMTAGRGYIALAALIFAKWRPWYALSACLLFGLLDTISIRYPNIDLGLIVIPAQFTTALPYILTVVILAGFIGKAVPPRAGGVPYVKER